MTRAALGTFLLVLLVAAPAAAHANLVGSVPRAGEAVPVAPERVVVTMSEAVDASFSTVRVENADGVRLDKGDVAVEGRTMSVGVPALPHGIYRIRWQALSLSDGHTTRGSTPFVVGDASLAVGLDGGAVQETETGGAPEAAARAVAYAGYAAVVGGLVFAAVVLPRLPGAHAGLVRPVVLLGCAAVALSALVLLFQAASRNGSAILPFLLDARTGNLLLVRVAGAALVATCASGPAVGRWAGAALMVGALAASGHAAAVGAPYAIADAFHVASVSAWLGGLGLLLVLAWRRAAPVGDLVAAFTPVATACVAVLVLSGVVDLLAIADVGTLLATAWGRLMAVKIGLVAVMLALGGTNGFVLPRRGGERWFRRSVAAEFALGLVVLVLAGLITNGSPAYAGAAAPAEEAVARFEGQAGNLTLELVVGPTPLAPGLHRFDLLVKEPAGGDHSITNVTLEFSMPSDRSGGEVAVALDPVDHGTQYGTEGAYLTRPGTWQVDAKIRRTDAYDVKATFVVVIEEEKTAWTEP